MDTLRAEVEAYVQNQLENSNSSDVRASKVIHDTVLGTNVFEPYEVALLDLPIVQRLRRISQVDVVSLVFPSGNHNRFEHSLGVTVIAGKMAEALRLKLNLSPDEAQHFIKHVRIAAILHDVGHGPFSHISEHIYRHYDSLKELKKKEKVLAGANAHEILSYLIVTSSAFKEFFQKKLSLKYDVSMVDLDLVGQMIVGYVADPKKAYYVDVINGAFDADKLDYIQRDSHFTGIRMALDIDRIFHTIDTIFVNDKQRLTLDISGVSALEEIVFNKMILFSTVYHHHKVRAAECLFRSIFDQIRLEKKSIYGLNFDSSADFLYLTDDNIFSLARQGLGKISELASYIYSKPEFAKAGDGSQHSHN